jgi:hypothetical protein
MTDRNKTRGARLKIRINILLVDISVIHVVNIERAKPIIFKTIARNLMFTRKQKD